MVVITEAGRIKSQKAWICAWSPRYNRNNIENGIKFLSIYDTSHCSIYLVISCSLNLPYITKL